ncbi:PucR family transcriptional regulator [Paenibacillus spiritus]|uniref:PucR family transcriptional regulator n=1 Tax=Paenibacillus spiritus TaxID=2496557 RepID=A0A5J5G583_9BACL|nr:PucR family transcriptional regulator [Paenibacillus spiritus]
MNSETLRLRLGQITGRNTGIELMGKQQAASLFGVEEQGSAPVLAGARLWVRLHEQEGKTTALWIDGEGLTALEQELISLAAANVVMAPTLSSAHKEEGETEARELGAWLERQLEQDQRDAEIPEEMGLKSRTFGSMIPFLLVSETVGAPELTYGSLMKLVRSYLDKTALLIPLQDKEWLVLAREELLTGSEEKEEDEDYDTKDLLAQAAMGLHELIASEWGGLFHLGVAPAMVPAKELVGSTALLRETLILGRIFQIGEYIHLPWRLHLERLVNSIPESRRRLLLEQFGQFASVMADKEMLLTLETFFEMECNVSETAKKLYIHRNTLLYRLDKIKQETGADVRVFGDAAIVKLTLLLYKVTKRK